MNQLCISNISKSFGNTRALDDATIHFEEERIHALAGESGSGKTTLLRIIAGLIPPDSGTIELAGNDITDLPAEKRDIGLVFQDHALFPHLTAAQNISYGLPHLTRAKRRDRVEEMLAAVQLPDLAKRYPNELSGGQQQRIAIARALAPSPSVLLFDEPFSNLDPLRRSELGNIITKLSEESGTLSIIVTHDLTDARKIASSITTLKCGRVCKSFTAENFPESDTTHDGLMV